MNRLQDIETLIEPLAGALGYQVVRVRLSGARPPVLQVMAERDDGTMNVDDCARLSHAISEAFETDDPIEGEYVLEVSSPGIDRPLTRRRDFESFAGHEARLELRSPVEGRKRVKGTLKGLKGEDVLIEIELPNGLGRSVLPIAYENVGDAKLVLTDALIAEDMKRRKAAGKALPTTE